MRKFISKGIMRLYILSLSNFDEGSRNGQHVVTLGPFTNSELAGRRASVVPTLVRVQELT